MRERRINDKVRCFGASIGINILFLLIVTFFYYPEFETPDDYGMNAIVNGVFGKYDEHLVFSHIWLGKMIVWLNKLNMTINWYSVLQYATVFVSFCFVCYVLIQKNNQMGIILSFVLLASFGIQMYIHPQFTKTAGVTTIVGIFLIIVNSELFLPGMILMILGAMWRWSGWLLWPALMVPLGVVEVIKGIWQKEKSDVVIKIKKYAGIVCITGLTILVCIGLWKLNDAEYAKDSEWQEYLEWDVALSNLMDYFFPYYYDDYDLYQSMGISEEDLNYYMTWNVADTSVLTTDNLHRLLKAREAYWTSLKVRALSFIKIAPEKIVKISVFPIVLLIGILFVMLHEKNSVIFFPLEVIAIYLLYFIMYYRGRVFVNRVDVPIMFSVFIGFSYYVVGTEITKVKKKNLIYFAEVFLPICSIVLGWNMGKPNLRQKYNVLEKERNVEFLYHISNDKEHLYIGTTGTIPITSMGVFERLPEGSLDNTYGTLGWLVNTPITENVLEQHGVENLYRDCIDNKAIYWVGGECLPETVNYICDNYEEVTFEDVANVEGWQLFYVKSD